MKTPITGALVARPQDHGAECILEPGHSASDVFLESPSSLEWMVGEHSLVPGASSYAVTGNFLGVKIGRDRSIGEQV